MGEGDRHFSFRGRPRSARHGETLLSALASSGVPLLRRSIRYHRPQGPFCGVGYCAGCLVRVNGRPNVRACRYEPTAGDVVTIENAGPSPQWDLLGGVGPLAPGGVDTLHGPRRPAGATRLYQRLVRRLAGTGAPLTEAAVRTVAAPVVERSADVLVVGAGDMGRAVVAALVAAGVRPVVVERSVRPDPVAGAELLAATTAMFLPPAPETPERRFGLLAVREPAQGVRLHARSVVLATGGYDASLLFGGNDRPGVMSADAALSLSAPPARVPFARAVVVGGDLRAAEVLGACAASVEAVVAPGGIRPEVVRAAADSGVALYPRTLLLGTEGRKRVRAVRVRARGDGISTRIGCDAVVLAHRRLPHTQLFVQTGAAMEWHPGVGAYFPSVDPNGATSVPGLFAAGTPAGIPVADRTAHARSVADAVVRGAGPSARRAPHPPVGPPTALLGYYREVLRLPGHGRFVACPCVDVLVSEVEASVRSGDRGIEVVKRRSSLGTGVCQGRYCLPDALLLLSILEGRPPEAVGYIAERPPAVPTPLAAFAALPSDPG